MVAAGGSVAGAFLFGQREGIRQAKTVTASTTVMASTTGVQNATVNLVGPASYIIYIDGSTIKAQNGLTGQIDYSNTDAATVIQNAINALPSTGGQIILREGQFTINSTIVLKPQIYLVGQGYSATRLRLGNNKNMDLISGSTTPTVQNRLGVSIANLAIDGNKASQTLTCHGIHFNGYKNCRFTFIRIDNCNGDGFYQEGGSDTFQFVLDQVMSYGNALNGFHMTGSNNLMEWCFGNTNTAVGIRLEGDYQSCLVKCEGESNGSHGFYILTSHHITLLDCDASSNTGDGVRIDTSYATTLLACLFSENTGSGITVRSSASDISYDNSIISSQMSKNTRYGYEEINGGAGVPTQNKLESSYFTGNTIAPALILSTINLYSNNIGFVTENSGQATILNGRTSVTVAHGLAEAPNLVLAQGQSTETRDLWVEADANSITIYAPSVVTTNRNVYWYARCKPG